MIVLSNFFRLFLILFVLASFQTVLAASPLQPDRLTCEYVQNPLGINTRAPRFSWTMTSSARNAKQSAYEIIVSDQLAEIQSFKGSI